MRRPPDYALLWMFMQCVFILWIFRDGCYRISKVNGGNASCNMACNGSVVNTVYSNGFEAQSFSHVALGWHCADVIYFSHIIHVHSNGRGKQNSFWHYCSKHFSWSVEGFTACGGGWQQLWKWRTLPLLLKLFSDLCC